MAAVIMLEPKRVSPKDLMAFIGLIDGAIRESGFMLISEYPRTYFAGFNVPTATTQRLIRLIKTAPKRTSVINKIYFSDKLKI